MGLTMVPTQNTRRSIEQGREGTDAPKGTGWHPGGLLPQDAMKPLSDDAGRQSRMSP